MRTKQVVYGDEPWSVRYEEVKYENGQRTTKLLGEWRIVDSAGHVLSPHDAVQYRADGQPWREWCVSLPDWRIEHLLAVLKHDRDESEPSAIRKKQIEDSALSGAKEGSGEIIENRTSP